MPVSPTHRTVDAAGIKQRVDLLALIGRDTRLKRVAGTAGGEYAGPCPFCGGRDRLRVQPATRRWWCRRCGEDTHWADAIDYVCKREGVDFVEACRRLGALDRELGSASGTSRSRPGSARRAGGAVRKGENGRARSELPLADLGSCETGESLTTELAEDQSPTATWQAEALRFVAEAEAVLWSKAGKQARAYLQWRGLREQTLRTWRIGFQPREGRRDPAAAWGFPEPGHVPASGGF
jgi:DNA primase